MPHLEESTKLRPGKFIYSLIRQALAFGAILVFGFANARAQSTNIAIGSTQLQSSVKAFGINLSDKTYYDAGQVTKNLVSRNPGFEGEIYNSTIRCVSGGATTCVDDDPWSAWPAGFWNGATFEVFYGASQGRTGTVSSYSAANGGSGGTFTFSTSGVAPATGDYMIVRMTVPGNASAGWWPTTSGNGAITTNSSDLPPGTTGLQTAAVNAPTASDSATLTAYFDGDGGRSFVLLNGTFQLTFKAKGTGGSNAIALNLQRPGSGTYLNQTVNLTNTWTTYTFNFTAAESGSNLQNVALAFTTVGQDSFLLDDVSLTQTNSDPSNPTAFRDPVISTLETLAPGVVRLWAGQLGDTLDNLIADQFGRQRAGYWAFSTSQDDISYGLFEFLQLCETIGADPWLVVPSTFSTTDASHLIEYLAGSSSTPYGAKRAASGHPNPWTLSFTKIHLEFGNEAWNGSFKGGSIEYSPPYGQRAQAIFGAMRGNAAYIPSSFDLVLGGQAVWAGRNQDIQNNCNNNDSFAVAPYMMNTVDSFSTNEDLFGSTFAEPEAYVSPNGTAEGVSGGMMTLDQQAIQASNHPVPVVMYEMNLSTLEGGISQAALNSYASSLGAGLAVADAMLQQMRQGVLTQNLWNLTQYNFTRPDGKTVNLWGAVIDMGVTNQRRPQFLALQLANQAIGKNSTMLQTVHSGADPTWNQPLVNTVQLAGAHYLESFAFSNGSNHSLIVFNLHRTSALPVTFSGPNAPSGTVQVTLLTSPNLTDTNETAEVVSPVMSTSPNFNPAATLSLPPYSMTLLTWTGGGSVGTLPVITNVTASGITNTSATITWTTDQTSSSQVEYGITTAYGSLSANNSSQVTSHSVTLAGLTPGTTYNYAALSSNAAGLATSANFTFSTATGAPVITSVTATGITTTSATITWTTNQASSSQVEYGTTTAYGSLSANNASPVTSHSVFLNGLTPSTTYNYAVISGASTSANFTFATTGYGIATVPVISSVTSTAITGTSATITWTTDQASSSQVAYGTTTAYGLLSALNSTLVTSHSVTLTGLTPGATYDYDVQSANAGGLATSVNFTFSTPLQSGISPLGGAHNNTGTSSAPTSLSIGYNSGNNNTIVAVCALGSTTSSISSITDSGSTWALQAFANNGTAVRSEIWSTSAGGSVASTSFTVNISGGTPTSCALEEYSGVLSLGKTATAQGTSGIWSVTLTTQDANNYVAAGIGANSYYGYSNPTGSLRQSGVITSNSGSNYVEMALFDKAGATASPVTNGVITSPAPWAALALELRSVNVGIASVPVISAVNSSGITGTSATITWTTDQASSSQVEYGTTTAYGSLSANSAAQVTSHSVTLSGLTPGATYDYAVLSSNAAGLATSANFTFSTPAGVPVISAVNSSAVTGTSATITWTTDQASSSQVEYGTTTAYGSLSANNASPVTSHSVNLSGLTPGTTYNYAVLSSSGAGLATSANFTFSTPGGVPVISAVNSSGITGTSAIITWTTDQASSSQVEYGTTTAYGSLSANNASPVTSHSVTLSGLTPGTTYDYAVLSSNAAGLATSANFTFSTPAGVPVISAVNSSGITTTSATITWTTDQASSSQVEYGNNASYGSLSANNASPVTSHSVTLSGLTPGTIYSYAALSANAAGLATSANFTFATASASSGPAPNVQNVSFWGVTGSGITISWSTDQPSSTSVEFGTTAALGQTSPIQMSLTENHGLTLSGLSDGTTYYFRAQSTNAANVTGYSAIYSFKTLDTTAPVISNIQVTPGANHTATLTWSLSKLATSQVEFGTTTSYGLWSSSNVLTQSPSITPNYIPSGTIHYRLHSTDPSGNQVVSPDYTFIEP